MLNANISLRQLGLALWILALGCLEVRAAESVSFELDVQPIFSAFGCNSGPCHGKQRGQNGFQLSLLGFDSDFDYNALTQDARGRRLFPPAPHQSLLLQKATGELPHGGGRRFDRDSAGLPNPLQLDRPGRDAANRRRARLGGGRP